MNFSLNIHTLSSILFLLEKMIENTQACSVEVIILIYHQILQTSLKGKVLQLEERTNNQIRGVKGLKIQCSSNPLSYNLSFFRAGY